MAIIHRKVKPNLTINQIWSSNLESTIFMTSLFLNFLWWQLAYWWQRNRGWKFEQRTFLSEYPQKLPYFKEKTVSMVILFRPCFLACCQYRVGHCIHRILLLWIFVIWWNVFQKTFCQIFLFFQEVSKNWKEILKKSACFYTLFRQVGRI
jgi:hypothetical protein